MVLVNSFFDGLGLPSEVVLNGNVAKGSKEKVFHRCLHGIFALWKLPILKFQEPKGMGSNDVVERRKEEKNERKEERGKDLCLSLARNGAFKSRIAST